MLLFRVCTCTVFAFFLLAAAFGARQEDGVMWRFAWEEAPKTVSEGVHLHHPDAWLDSVSLDALGPRSGQLKQADRSVRLRFQDKSLPLNELDLDRLQLRDRSGLWVAKPIQRAREKGERVIPGLLEVRWESAGAVQFYPIVQPLRTWTRGTQEISSFQPRVRMELFRNGQIIPLRSSDAQQVVGHLPAGEYTAEFHAQGHLPRKESFRITAGALLDHEVRLAREPGLRDVHVRIEAGPGPEPWAPEDSDVSQEPKPWSLSLSMHAPEVFRTAEFLTFGTCGVGRDHVQPIRWEREGANLVGRTTFLDVGRGPISLLGHCSDSQLVIDKPAPSAGTTTFTVHLLREQDLPGWGFELTMEPLDGKRTALSLFGARLSWKGRDGQPARQLEITQPRVVFPERLIATPRDWVISLPGYQTVRGTSADFLPADTGQRIAKLTLKPGIHLRVLAHSPSGDPIPSLPIYADGKLIANTDERGVAVLRSSQVPHQLQAHWNGKTWSYRIPRLNALPPEVSIEWDAQQQHGNVIRRIPSKQ